MHAFLRGVQVRGGDAGLESSKLETAMTTQAAESDRGWRLTTERGVVEMQSPFYATSPNPHNSRHLLILFPWNSKEHRRTHSSALDGYYS